ncbi:zinc metallopeptidase [Hoeflea sp. WL0058]|uniref:Zinc metallopeptidase n=1 Tax=Flavimaribacter sediminis TaxID=2865987 RepID=A0AAE2ZNE3_9HYPH|nr:zinc metallopeptidase [Flavimaribacter sediminis]MBW8639386.1 zinc metallopeptidase [Flavimaribacter sediminis]
MLLIGVAAILLLIFGPMVWVHIVMARHRGDRDDFAGTGGELARHLLDLHDLKEVPVEQTDAGDHYDPAAKTVRLTQQNFDGRSITAVAVAAHEVGHAIQDRDSYGPLKWRETTVRTAAFTDQLGSLGMVALSVLGSAVATPRLLLFGAAAVVLMGLVRVLAHLVTLPVEFDASFKRGLPILEQGGYLGEPDMPAARSVLKAAAFTYVAASLMQILNLFRILRFLR